MTITRSDVETSIARMLSQYEPDLPGEWRVSDIQTVAPRPGFRPFRHSVNLSPELLKEHAKCAHWYLELFTYSDLDLSLLSRVFIEREAAEFEGSTVIRHVLGTIWLREYPGDTPT